MEVCYYDQEYCMDTEYVLQTYRNNIKVVFLYLYCFFVFNCLMCFITLYTTSNTRIEIDKNIYISEELENKKNKKSWFIDYSVE